MQATQKRAVLFGLATLAAAGALPRSARAQDYEIEASGFVTDIMGQTNFLDGSVQVGTPYTFTYVFSTQAPNLANPAIDPKYGLYELPGDTYGATVRVGDYTLRHAAAPRFPPTILSVENGTTGTVQGSFGDTYIQPSSSGAQVTSTNPQAVKPFSGFSELSLFNKPGSLLSSNAQPPLSEYTPGNFALGIYDFPFTTVFYYNATDPNADTTTLAGSITSLSARALPAAPEPSQTAALGLGSLALMGLTLKARRRTASAA